MSWGDVLVIVGCLAAGYWIVSSIIGKGIDIIDSDGKAKDGNAKDADAKRVKVGTSIATPPASPAKPLPRLPAMHDWHIVLDLPRDASRSEIEAAFKRRRAQAEASGDQAAIALLRRALDAGRKAASGG